MFRLKVIGCAAVLMMARGHVLRAQTLSWVPQGPPPARGNPAIVFDRATESTLLFGGANGRRVLGDTWVWSDGWRQMFSADSPSPRTGAAMAWDGAVGNVVLFGGSTTYPVSPGSSLSDTWTWDGTAWTQQFPPVSPPARVYAASVYNPLTKTVLLFGGANLAGGAGAFGDTWAWDGRAKTWTQLSPASSPSPRAANQLVFDEANGTVVLFGGVVSNLENLDDTWTWDGRNWKQQFPTTSPSPRNGPALAYDKSLHAVILFGGAVGSCCATSVNDTWGWDGSNWKRILPSGPLPFPRNGAGLDYDDRANALLLFGGQTAKGDLNDTWLLPLK